MTFKKCTGYFLFNPKQSGNATNMQGLTESEIESERKGWVWGGGKDKS